MSSSSISVIPTLDMVAQQGAELNRDIQLNAGSNIRLYDPTDATYYEIEAAIANLQVTSNLASTYIELITSAPLTGYIGLTPEGVRLTPPSTLRVMHGGNRGSRVPTITGDPAAGINGDVCYNTTMNKFRVYENGAWANMV